MLQGYHHATVLRSPFSSNHGTVGLPVSLDVKTTLRKPRANSRSVLHFPRPPTALLIAQVRHRSCLLAGTWVTTLPRWRVNRCCSLIKAKDMTYDSRILGWEGPLMSLSWQLVPLPQPVPAPLHIAPR